MTASLLGEELEENRRLGLAPPTREATERWVRQTRLHGIARTSDFIPGISGVAAPVFDYNGNMAMALVALGYSGDFDLSLKGPLVATLLTAAHRRSERLGHRDA